MKRQHDIDKLKAAIEDGLLVYEDVEKALEDDKISWIEGGTLVVKHGGKAIRLIGTLKEISEEIIDLDHAEAAEIVELITTEFGSTPEAHEAITEIAEGAGKLNQGIQKLIALKKR